MEVLPSYSIVEFGEKTYLCRTIKMVRYIIEYEQRKIGQVCRYG